MSYTSFNSNQLRTVVIPVSCTRRLRNRCQQPGLHIRKWRVGVKICRLALQWVQHSSLGCGLHWWKVGHGRGRTRGTSTALTKGTLIFSSQVSLVVSFRQVFLKQVHWETTWDLGPWAQFETCELYSAKVRIFSSLHWLLGPRISSRLCCVPHFWPWQLKPLPIVRPLDWCLLLPHGSQAWLLSAVPTSAQAPSMAGLNKPSDCLLPF